jgi:hypothetical protein
MQLVGHIADLVLFHVVTSQLFDCGTACCKAMRQVRIPSDVFIACSKNSGRDTSSNYPAGCYSESSGSISESAP